MQKSKQKIKLRNPDFKIFNFFLIKINYNKLKYIFENIFLILSHYFIKKNIITFIYLLIFF